MATAYTSLLGLALPVTGELSGSWGDTVNTAITSLLDNAVAGTTSITADADITLTTTTGVANQARQAIILWNPASGTVTRNITAPAQSKIYTVINASGGTQSIVFRGAGPTTGVTIIKGESAVVAWNGTDFIKISNTGGAGSFTNVTISGTTTLSGLTASTALALDASKNVVSVTNTGTGNNVLSASPTLTGTVTVADLTDSSLTATRVTYAGVGGNLVDSANMTFNGTRLTVADLADSGLTSGRVTYASTGGNLVDSANLTFNGTTLVAADLTDSSLTSGRVTYAGTGGNLVDSANLTFNGTTLTANALTVTNAVTLTAATANGVMYANGSKVLTTGSALTFDGTTLTNTAGGLVANAALTLTGVSNAIKTVYLSNFADAAANWNYIRSSSGVFDIVASGSNSLAFSASASEGMRLTSTGLGIGTSSPGALLDVAGSARATGLFQRFDNSGLSLSGGTAFNTTGAGISLRGISSAFNTYGMEFYAGGSERMRLDSSGNLGIGTSSPDAGLTVIKSATISSQVNVAARIGSGVTSDLLLGSLNGNTPFIASQGAYPLNFYTNATERMRIAADGNVGIGTTSPTARLTVSGVAGNGNGLMSVDGSDFIRVFGDVNFGPAINWSTGDSLRFATSDSAFGGFTERMRLDSSGNLGIGTSSGIYRLEVIQDQNAATYARVRNNDTGSSAYAGVMVNASGNTWAMRMGSSAANSNALQFVQDAAGSPTVRATLDSSGNLGLGVTPSAWNSSIRALETATGAFYSFASGSVSNFYMLSNAFVNSSGTPTYKQSAASAQYLQTAGQHQFFTAPSGTAGNAISFTQAMSLTADGNLAVGLTSTSFRVNATVQSGANRDVFAAQIAGASNGLTIKWNHATTTTRVNISNLPTSASGLASGDLWNDGGTLKIA